MKVLYGVNSWGLGHASRSLPIMRKLINEKNEVTVVSSGRTLEYLKKELGKSAKYLKLHDYPKPYSKYNLFLAKFSAYLPLILKAIAEEQLKTMKIINKGKYNLLISDHRYGFGSRKIPSYLMMHQLRLVTPFRLAVVEEVTELFHFSMLLRFKKIIVPDFKNKSLSGDLSHSLDIFNGWNVEYIGPLSDLRKRDLKEDIDYLFTISGPEPSRTVFQKKILEQIKNIDGKIVVVLGKAEKKKSKQKENIEIHDYLKSDKFEEIMNRSKMIVSRSGYSTLMDIVELKKKAMFVPTPQQTEQEYLARYHKKKKYFYSVSQKKLNLKKDLKRAKKYKGFPTKGNTKKSVENFMRIINK
jgi:uncharacterized protein (TIGR00661 family)